MPQVTRRPAPSRTETFDDGLAPCPACGQPLIQAYHRTRFLVTLQGTLRLLLKVRSCRNPACAQAKRSVRPFGEGMHALPRHEFGLDIIAQIGNWRYREHKSVPERMSNIPRLRFDRSRTTPYTVSNSRRRPLVKL